MPTAALLALTVLAAVLLAGVDPVIDRVYLALTGSKAPFPHFPHNDSPTTLLLAVCMLLLFARVKLRWGGKLASALGGASFGVYLIHDHPLVRQLTISRYAYHLAGLDAVWIVPGVILAAVGVYAVCAGIDCLRERLFRALGVRRVLAAAEQRIAPDLWMEEK